MNATPYDQAQRTVHTAILIGLIAPVFEYLRFLFLYMDSDSEYFEFSALLGLAAFVVGVPVAWFLTFPVIQAASAILHPLLGGTVRYERWQDATYRALWPLPIAAALGAITSLVYSLCKFGGWPAGMIFGAIANALGAWCYVTIFWSWFKLRRETFPAQQSASVDD